VLRKTIVLEEGGSTEVAWPTLVSRPGSIWCRAGFEVPDDMPFDDVGEGVFSVHSLRSVRVLDCRGGGVFHDEATKRLKLALDPLAGTDGGRVRAVRIETGKSVRPGTDAALVALYGPRGPCIPPGHAERLRGAIERGASLLWVPDLSGEQGRSSALRAGRSQDGLLPLSIERIETRPPVADDPGWRLGIVAGDSPLMKPFSLGRNGDLTAVRIRRRLRLAGTGRTWPRGRSDMDRLQVLARFDDGHPALVRGRMGSGFVYQLAFGLTDSGGIAVSAAWPILLAEYIECAVDHRRFLPAVSEQEAGSPSGPSWFIGPISRDRTFRIDGPWFDRFGKMKPHSWTVTVPAGSDGFTSPMLRHPGLYRVHVRGRDVSEWFTCRSSPAESAADTLPISVRKALDAAASASGGAVVDGVGELRRTLVSLKPGRPVSSWFWALFALAMLAELAMLALRRRSG
jgi:hypothetical protein